MITHLFKLIWNRKRTNFLVTLEIFFAFLVLCALITVCTYYYTNYRKPLGFAYENVWDIVIDSKQGDDPKWTMKDHETLQQLYKALRSFEEVEAVGGITLLPYTDSNWTESDSINGKRERVSRTSVNEDFNKAMDVEVTRGRWFEKADEALGWRPVIINEYYAKLKFGEQDPLGKRLREPNPNSKRPYVEERIVGVVKEFRKGGEFSDVGAFVIDATVVTDTLSSPPWNIVIKVQPGTTGAFEEKMVKMLESTAKDWSFKAQPLSLLRQSYMRRTSVPLMIFGMVTGFLILMVALGLVGVVWQNVTARTREIGLRRATGATGSNIYNQILSELLVMATLGLLCGVVVVAQFPLLRLIKSVSLEVYSWGLLISLGIVYLVTLLCGLYPSWLATRVQPTEALHYE